MQITYQNAHDDEHDRQLQLQPGVSAAVAEPVNILYNIAYILYNNNA